MTTKRFAIAVSPVWRPFLFGLGVTPKQSFIEIGEEDVHVCFGRSEYHFPLEAVEEVSLGTSPLWAGVGARTNYCSRLSKSGPTILRSLTRAFDSAPGASLQRCGVTKHSKPA